MPLALYTFGQFIEPADNRANDGFHALNDPIFGVVDQAEGMIARSGYASDAGPLPWGDEVYPRFYVERGDGWSPATLSLWRDIESLVAFTYSGLHAEALRRGHEWFRKGDWPPLVLWWHDAGNLPTWSQGVERYEHLHDHGPSPFAFTVKVPFDRNGTPARILVDRVREIRGRVEVGRA
jgi:hypothetical protein